ncbi:MAG: UvrABC system protein C, partial [Candidatus Peregrinibacteria bacterium GW2011_GWA2_43_8]
MVPEINTKIQRILKKLPAKPGVYKMLDKEGMVLYVGKAKDLKKRVSSYFRDVAKLTVRISKMISKVEDISYITVDSELEALILELNLIKELQPKYNVMLKDDKDFCYVKVFVSEDFPRVKVVRRVEKDDERYFGPKTSTKKVYKTLEVLKSLLPFRDCDLGIKYISDNGPGSNIEVYKKTIKYPCLQYHINTCIAPCTGACTKDSYRFIINKVCKFLEGDSSEILSMLKNDMEIAVRERKFEDAAKIRDKLNAINGILERQKISGVSEANQDIVGFYLGVGKVFLNLFVVREGRLIDSENFTLEVPDVSEGDVPEVIESFLRDYYEKCSFKPDSVLLPFELEEQTFIKVIAPKRGEKSKLVEMSNKNAENFYKQMLVRWEADKAYDPAKSLVDLGERLSVSRKIKRIEGYDISHFSGDFTVGAMVVFPAGEPANGDYRH